MVSEGDRPAGDQPTPASCPPRRGWGLFDRQERAWSWDPRAPRRWTQDQEGGESLWSHWSGRWRSGDQDQDGRFKAFCRRLQERWRQQQ
ncbi:hypothetical protein FJT64_022049 [Amphibalanus amphitrite]|uniref:Uncharacterized protein n=1 Tax=Amphibalanus amphitrite TaxID=1232801 RepID=A0A6A4WI17_AMPAM|nr:hypothetical protein FJT64_022049 [Amphibalanus amphitrite]